MNIIYSLFVVFVVGHPGTETGKYFNTLKACEAAAKAYTSPYCVPVNADGQIYGNTWACMHGCTWQENLQRSGVDARPTDPVSESSTGECVH